MADRKFFPSFGYDRLHRIGPTRRRYLCEKFDIAFTDDDFAEMAHAVDAARGAYEALRAAPSPQKLIRQFELIRESAHQLRTLLKPQLIESQADLSKPPIERSRPSFEAAKEAANRLLHELRLGASLPIEMSDRGEKARIAEIETFLRVLAEIPMYCDLLGHSVQESDRENLPWMITTERGTGHLLFLLRDLAGIAARHGKPARYTKPVGTREDEPAYSFRASLAFCLGRMLPRDARPQSEAALIAQMQRHLPEDS